MDQIISREAMRQRGAEAFNDGRPRDSHNMNWHSPALAEWLAGFDEAAQAWHAEQHRVRVYPIIELAGT
ncbi:hypothetical protein [uncultured Massilia sp.]|uniref:hypothetical protein n=1 Tax=uncultured Massilia sp. TaxID=169973 RepID=UPI00259065B4|nr:hypothetical protein [uncultured Massilia sp.]